MSIRFKVILPYLLLTLLVAVTGVYVVTRLVASSLSERLTNQLLESGRVVSDTMARQEIKHVEIARLISFTRGVAEAIQAGDASKVSELVTPLAGGQDAENFIVIDPNGEELLHIIKVSNGSIMDVPTPTGAADMPIAQKILGSTDPNTLPLRGLGKNPIDNRYYYYTAVPVALNGNIVGVVMIGTSLEKILPYLKSVSLADVIIYTEGGQAITTTMGAQTLDVELLNSLSIPSADYDTVILSDTLVQGENFKVDNRWYSLARGPLRVGNDRIAVFAVVLPMNFVIQPGAASRNTYVFIFAAAMIGVVLIGYFISRLIINPLSSLVRTSQAIAGGDLTIRSGIRSKDEIGTLASTFDGMTANLQQRNAELEKMYQILEQMDKTKDRFIDVSAHELRSPLTVAKAYAQMVDSKTQDKPEVQSMTKGLIEGIDRMIDIVNSMLDVTRIDSKTLKMAPDQVLINTVIMKVQKTFQAALQERKLTLRTIGVNDLPVMMADPDLIYKVFYHLIMNAIKYTPDGGTITVRGRKVEEDHKPPEVEIVVEDTGIGLAPEHHELIFEKFFQTGEVMLHSSGKTKFKGGGPGLGLAIARGIVEAHQGRIWVESPGHDETNCPGSKFFVRLPLEGSKA
ncbi:MAG TPA: ATP-binding protein [Anaerolineales bacterium]|nr:ATP-binding protein [Anaerolineales bacterium]